MNKRVEESVMSLMFIVLMSLADDTIFEFPAAFRDLSESKFFK